MQCSGFLRAMLALAVFCCAAPCHAGSLNAYLNTPTNNGTVVISYNLVNGSGYSGGAESGSYGYAGQIPWTVQSGGTDILLALSALNSKRFAFRFPKMFTSARPRTSLLSHLGQVGQFLVQVDPPSLRDRPRFWKWNCCSAIFTT